MRAPQVHTGKGIKEDTMVPGITDTDCRIAQFRYREVQAEAERQRLADLAVRVPPDRVGVMETMQRHVGALTEQVSQFLQGVRTPEATEHAAAPGTLAMGK
jgi:hypothetical protein